LINAPVVLRGEVGLVPMIFVAVTLATTRSPLTKRKLGPIKVVKGIRHSVAVLIAELEPSQAEVSCFQVLSLALISILKEVIGEALELGAVQSIFTFNPTIDVTAATGVAGALAESTEEIGEYPMDHPNILRTLYLNL
jgi:hypothetical protein